MRKRREVNRIVLQKMLEYCNDIDDFMSHFNASYEVYLSDKIFRSSVDMYVLQIGELTTRLTDDFKAQHSEIPWRKIKGLRNVYVHDYENVDFEQAWLTLTKDIPELKMWLEQVLAAEGEANGN